MRIAFYTPRASHLEPGESGDRVFVRTLLAALRELGHEIAVVSRVNVRDFWRGRLPAHRLVTESISVQRAMKRFSPDAWLTYGARPRNPDLFGWWQRPKRYVLLNTDAGPAHGLPRCWRPLFAFAHGRALARADRVVAYDPDDADSLRCVGVLGERLRVLPLAIKPWDSVPSREEARARLGLPQEAPIILGVSRITAPWDDGKFWKTEWLLVLLELLAQAPLPSGALFLLVGDGRGRPRVQEDVARLKLESRVRLVGSVPHDEVRWFYAACDFFVSPGYMTLLEAQACGRPVVMMRTRSTELIVDAGRTGLLANNLEEAQAYIVALATDRARCDWMGRAAHEHVEKFHSIEVRVRQIEDLLLGRG